MEDALERAYNESCPICLDEEIFTPDDDLILLQPCLHMFCEDCINNCFRNTDER